jgi:uncharacterized caspase-like protein
VLSFKVMDQGGGIGRVRYRINGQELEGRPEGIGVPGQSPVNRRFNLGPGKNVVSVTVANGKSQVESRAIETIVNVRQSGERPSLYVLAVGVTTYRDHDLSLKYAADDASAIAKELGQRGTGFFKAVHIKEPLLNNEATAANITTAFEHLSREVKEEDVFILFLAGHGTAFDGEYHFIPWEVVYENEAALRARSLNQSKLQELLRKIPAQKTLVLLDTCSAGAFTPGRAVSGEKAAIDRLMKVTGRAVLAATSDTKMALEGHEGHGVFTYALLQALAGKALESNDNQAVDIDELASYVAEEVPKITLQRWGYEQFPMRDLQGASFAIGRRP